MATINSNKQYSQIPVGDADFLVQEAVGDVGLPYGFQNKDLNTASMTNKALGNAGLTFEEATFTFEEGAGTFDNPYSFRNKSIN